VSNAVVSATTPSSPFIDTATGQLSFAWMKWFQAVGRILNDAFDSQAIYQGSLGANVTLAGRVALLAVILSNLTDASTISSDHVTDGVGDPISGGKIAYEALVTSHPATGEMLQFNGTDWVPVASPLTLGKIVSKWLDSFNAATGVFTQSQPNFTDLAGAAAVGQIPPLPLLTGQISTSQLPPSGLSGTITTAKLTIAGANGSMTFTNGILTAEVAAT
jgi:hypothetical protein